MAISDLWDSVLLPGKLYRMELEPVCDQYGLTRMELDILLFLANHPEYDTARDIIEKRKLTKSHVSASIARLRERGCLETYFEEGNRKTVHLKLLPASREMVIDGQAAQKRFFDLIFTGFSEVEKQAVGEGMRKIAVNARKALKEE